MEETDRHSYELLLKERDDLQREAQTAHAELYAVLKQSDYRSSDELALDCMARMAIEAQQTPLPEFPADVDEVRIRAATRRSSTGASRSSRSAPAQRGAGSRTRHTSTTSSRRPPRSSARWSAKSRARSGRQRW
jgi:hypothetical protein